jgi:beta-glucanase (GH16 family)
LNTTAADLAEFDERFFFIFNVAVGGNWPGNPDATTVFPQKMIVDYVRVFQQ